MIYLIRHTKPLIEKGICYGQTDLDLYNTFEQEAEAIKKVLPKNISKVYSSPLQRCSRLANYLFDDRLIEHHHTIKEINCGDWEMIAYNDIPEELINPWMEDFVNVGIPNGESYLDLYHRVVNQFNEWVNTTEPIAIVTHGGPIRSMLSYITNTPLKDSFTAFTIHYGATVEIKNVNGSFSYTVMHNPEPIEPEVHRKA
jgi:alpha-ribazole phosphatase